LLFHDLKVREFNYRRPVRTLYKCLRTDPSVFHDEYEQSQTTQKYNIFLSLHWQRHVN